MNRRDDFRQPISREELYERQREQQAKQAERKSWVEELNEEFPSSDFVFGVSPVLAAFRAKRRTIHRLYIQDSMEMSKRKDSSAILEIKAEAEKMGCDVVEVDKGRLNVLSDNRPHQGLVIVCSPLSFEPLKTMPPAPQDGSQDRPPLWLVLDEVMDPQVVFR